MDLSAAARWRGRSAALGRFAAVPSVAARASRCEIWLTESICEEVPHHEILSIAGASRLRVHADSWKV